MSILINKLKSYNARNPKKKKSRQEVLDNEQKLYNIGNDIINAFENKIFFRQSDIDNITKDFSEQTDMPELNDGESKKKEKSKQKKYLYEKWTTPIKESNIRRVYNFVADLLNNNKVFKIDDNEVITAVLLSHFLENFNKNKFNTRDDAIKYYSDRIYAEYESKLNLIKDDDAKK